MEREKKKGRRRVGGGGEGGGIPIIAIAKYILKKKIKRV